MINTFEDLKKYALKNNEIHLKDSFDENTLKVFDYMLQYLSDKNISFKIYSCIHYSKVNNRKYDYKIDFVLSDYVEECEKSKRLLSFCLCEVVYSSDKDEISTNVDSFIEYMQWQKNVKDDFKDMYPDYHISFEFKLEKNHKNPLYRKILNKHINYINVFVPHYVIRDELDKIYEEMKPLLKKHKVDRITFFKTGTNEMLEEIIKNENLVHNVYSKNKNIIWEKYYDYKNNIKYKYDKKQEKYVKNKFYNIYEMIRLPYYIILFIIVFVMVVGFLIIWAIDSKVNKKPPF